MNPADWIWAQPERRVQSPQGGEGGVSWLRWGHSERPRGSAQGPLLHPTILPLLPWPEVSSQTQAPHQHVSHTLV